MPRSSSFIAAPQGHQELLYPPRVQPDVERLACPARPWPARRPVARMRAQRGHSACDGLGERSGTSSPVSGVNARDCGDVGGDRHGAACHRLDSTRDIPSVFRCEPLTSTSAACIQRCTSSRWPSSCTSSRVPISRENSGGWGIPTRSSSGRGRSGAHGPVQMPPRMSMTPFGRVTCRRTGVRSDLRELPLAAQRGAVFRRTEPLQVHPHRRCAVTGGHAGRGGEARPRRVRVADEAVGEALEQRVEMVGPCQPDKPYDLGGGAALGERARERIARRVGARTSIACCRTTARMRRAESHTARSVRSLIGCRGTCTTGQPRAVRWSVSSPGPGQIAIGSTTRRSRCSMSKAMLRWPPMRRWV